MTAPRHLFSRTLSSDCDTPLAVFARLRDSEPCFLFESAEGGEHWGRYSIIGFAPACSVAELDDGLHIRHRDGREERIAGKTADDWLRRAVIDAPAVRGETADLPFTGGAVGYFSYDLVYRLEPVGEPKRRADDPISAFMLIDRFVIFDNLSGSMRLCVLAGEDEADAVAPLLDEIEMRLHTAPRPAPLHLDRLQADDAHPRAHTEPADYMAMVERAKKYIHAGDIFQVVLSQRFSAPLDCDPLTIYRAVRHINPSPYLFYLQLGETTLIGSSPEILVRKSGARAIVRPIAGTRPRGATDEEDAELARELLADAKERAEHVMLVDLGRNDLGRVCAYGSISVTDSMAIERYSHVMHIVSQVEGRLPAGVDALDLLAATFPAGTVSGAPKVRAMQIIDELEPEARGPYAGAVGYVTFGGGQMDTSIAIRTAVVRDDTVYVQAGAGIVADSVPEREHRECVNKAMAMFRAVALAGAQKESES